jgi:prevent-host-death family protein
MSSYVSHVQDCDFRPIHTGDDIVADLDEPLGSPTMADESTMEADRYARFPSKTSKEARANLPSLIDEVVDTGRPLVITKLKIGRAALIPARELWIHELVERLGMDRASAEKPIEELMDEVYEKLTNYRNARHESGMD